MTPRRTFAAALALTVALVVAAPAAASPYSDAVRADGAVNYVRLGDAPGTHYPLNSAVVPPGRYGFVSPVGIDWTSRGPVLGQPGAIAGDTDTAARFDGTLPKGSAHATLAIYGQERSLKQQHLTWEAWVKPGVVDATSRRVMANEGPWGGTLLAARADGVVFSRYLNPGDYRMYSPDSPYFARVAKTAWSTLVVPIDRTRWNHVVATYDLVTPSTDPRGTMRLYVNGGLAASRRSDFVPMLPQSSTDADVMVGSNTTGWLRYDGAIDEVATYTRTLSAADVTAHYRIGTTGR
jgi:hypothetical protein